MQQVKFETLSDSYGHPVFTRYPHLLAREMSHKITKEFAWLPITTLYGRRVWLESVVKTTFKTTARNGNYWYSKRRKTTFYETVDEVAQRKLSNEN